MSEPIEDVAMPRGSDRERYDAPTRRTKHPAAARQASLRKRSDQGVLALATLAVPGITVLL